MGTMDRDYTKRDENGTLKIRSEHPKKHTNSHTNSSCLGLTQIIR